MIAALALAAALGGPPETSGSLPGGGAYYLQRDSTLPTAAMELWYRVPSDGYGNASPGIARLTIAALAASAPAHGTSLSEAVKAAGGSLTINVYPDIAMVGIDVAPAQAPSLLRRLTETYFQPSLTASGYAAGERDCAIEAAIGQFDSSRLLQDALFAQLFASGPAHYAPVPTQAADYAKITQGDAAGFAARAFRQGNAIVSLAGDFDPAWLSQVRTGVSATAPAQDPPLDSVLSRKAAIDVTQAAPVTGMGFAWVGPPIADRKAATAMDFIADYLFDSDYGSVTKSIEQSNGDAFAAGQFITLHDPGVLLVTVGGSGASTLRTSVLDAVAAMSKPMDRRSFEAARNAFVYHILRDAQSSTGRADNAGWYAAEGDEAYAPASSSNAYLDAAQSLDAGFVARVAAKYLQQPAMVRLLAAPQNGASST